MLVTHGAIIMVADGAKMSLFRNRGKDFAPDLELIEHCTNFVASTAELGSDKPGRSFTSMGNMRSSYESSDYHQMDENKFATAAIEKLNILAKHSILHFIVVAAPRVLGLMRKHYSADLRKQLIAEINRDYAGHNYTDVADLLRHHEA